MDYLIADDEIRWHEQYHGLGSRWRWLQVSIRSDGTDKVQDLETSTDKAGAIKSVKPRELLCKALKELGWGPTANVRGVTKTSDGDRVLLVLPQNTAPQAGPDNRRGLASNTQQVSDTTVAPAIVAQPRVRPLAVDLAEQNLNLLLEGVPGTGKTRFFAIMCRYLDIGECNRFVLNCHPSTQYEDVIEGLRPKDVPQAQQEVSPWKCLVTGRAPPSTGAWHVVDGVFLRACAKARELAAGHENGHGAPPKVAILLDELNRANVPRILGDLMTALERSKRATFTGDGYKCGMAPLTLPLSGRKFLVPSNLIVVATMNSVDHSAAPLDQALLRRFWRVRVEPKGLKALGREKGLSGLKSECERFAALNEALEAALGPDGKIGHSFLFDMADIVGQVEASRVAAGAGETAENQEKKNRAIQNVWRFGVAPQVIAALSAAGAERGWARPDAFKTLKEKLKECSIEIEVMGEGATRGFHLKPPP